MSPMLKRKLLRWSGYSLFFLGCFLLFAYLTFPYDRLRAFIIQEVERPAGPDGVRRPSGYELEIEELSPSWFTGASLTGVQFTKLAHNPSDPPLKLAADDVTFRVSLLSLIFGPPKVSFDIEAGGGTLEGSYAANADQVELDVELDALDLKRMLPAGISGLPIEGLATGTVEIFIAPEPKDTHGSVDLRITPFVLGDGKSELQLKSLGMGLAVDRTNAGTLELKAPIESGVATIDRFSAKGPDVQIAGAGSIRLLKPLRASTVDTLLRIKLTDSYRAKHSWVAGFDAMVRFTPKLTSAQTPDKALQFKLQGSFGGMLNMVAAGSARPPPL